LFLAKCPLDLQEAARPEVLILDVVADPRTEALGSCGLVNAVYFFEYSGLLPQKFPKGRSKSGLVRRVGRSSRRLRFRLVRRLRIQSPGSDTRGNGEPHGRHQPSQHSSSVHGRSPVVFELLNVPAIAEWGAC